jgi:hypothetical protein
VIARQDPRVTAVGQGARRATCNRELALERLRRRLTDTPSTQLLGGMLGRKLAGHGLSS